MDADETGNFRLISEMIANDLHVPCGTLMGANIANEVAREQPCEATLGLPDMSWADVLVPLFSAPYFSVRHIFSVQRGKCEDYMM